MSVEVEKEKFLTMPLEEKRSYYTSGYTTVDSILTWPEYWKINITNIGRIQGKYPVHWELANKVSVWHGCISSLEIDAIVVRANLNLKGIVVDKALDKMTGGYLQKEVSTWGKCEIGEARITGGYTLPAKYVIHIVKPFNMTLQNLRESYENCLALVKENKFRTIAFPFIPSGSRDSRKPAADVCVSTVRKFIVENKDDVDRVIFCLCYDCCKEIYEELLQNYFCYF